MRRPHPHWRSTRLAVLDSQPPHQMIGEIYFEVTRPESPSHETNRHLAWVTVELLRAHRGSGLGRSLLPHVVSQARVDGRTVLQSWCEEADGKAFAEAIGARVVQRRRQNRLDMNRVDWSMVEAWAADGPRRNPGTTLRWFTNRIDDDILPAYCPLFTEAFNRQPFDEADPVQKRYGEIYALLIDSKDELSRALHFSPICEDPRIAAPGMDFAIPEFRSDVIENRKLNDICRSPRCRKHGLRFGAEHLLRFHAAGSGDSLCQGVIFHTRITVCAPDG